jgi:hypothetical protein
MMSATALLFLSSVTVESPAVLVVVGTDVPSGETVTVEVSPLGIVDVMICQS